MRRRYFFYISFTIINHNVKAFALLHIVSTRDGDLGLEITPPPWAPCEGGGGQASWLDEEEAVDPTRRVG